MKVYGWPMIGHGGLAAKENCLFMAPPFIEKLVCYLSDNKKMSGIVESRLLGRHFLKHLHLNIFMLKNRFLQSDNMVRCTKPLKTIASLSSKESKKKKKRHFLTSSNLPRGGEKSLNASVLWRSSGHFLTTPENSFGRNGHRKKHCP